MSKAKKIGTAFESDIRDAHNDWAGRKVCERVALHGTHDNGDLRIEIGDLILTGEAKKRKQYPSEGEIEGYKQQAIEECENAGTYGALLFVNLPRKNLYRTEVWMERSTYLAISGVDDFIRRVMMRTDSHDEGELEEWMVRDEHSWLRLTLVDYLWMVYGPPAWEWKGVRHK